MADFDTELLISSVEERPYLWDAAHKEYKDRDIRLKGWQEIAGSIVSGFKDFQEGEKKNWVTKLQKRWKTARDAYTKSKNKLATKKSGSGASKIVKYTYHDQLGFLDRVQKGRTESNFVADGDSLDITDTQGDEEPVESLAGISTNESSRKETDRTGNFKRKKPTKNSEFEESLLTLLKDSKENDDDDDRSFLMSLLPFLKSFNPDQKLMFRTQVLQLIISMRENRAPAPMPPTPTPMVSPNPSIVSTASWETL